MENLLQILLNNVKRFNNIKIVMYTINSYGAIKESTYTI